MADAPMRPSRWLKMDFAIQQNGKLPDSRAL